jgi:opacity protein-like surface antigen
MKKLGMIFGLLFLISGTASAENFKPYVGGGLGSGSDTAFELFGGIEINPNLSAEVAFINLGKSSEGLSGVFVGILPFLGNIDLFGKFGLSMLRTGWPTGDRDKTGLTGGVGLQLDFSPKSSVRLGYDKYQIGASGFGADSVDVGLLSGIFRF